MGRLITSWHKSDDGPLHYTDGGHGMVKWCNEKVFVPIYPQGQVLATWTRMGELPREANPVTGKSYWSMWERQQDLLKRCLVMKDSRLIYNLIVFCWMRGEGKSLLAVLVQLWKFFVFTKQAIMLGANSKDQIKFVHYDIIRDIINHSPELLPVVGPRNIQEKEIRMKDEQGNVASIIRSISSFSGIVSNITGFTFSEMFDMKNPRFYTQLYGSIRDVPNALGVIDSTVSDKSHVLYKLYTNYMEKKTRLLYFSYRQSRLGVVEDFDNPNMDEAQLNDYRENFPFGEFEKYFQNLWEAGALKIFTQGQIEETKYIGTNAKVMNHKETMDDVEKKLKLIQKRKDLEEKQLLTQNEAEIDAQMEEVDDRLWHMDYACNIISHSGVPLMVPMTMLERLGDMLETDFAILAGADFADPYSVTSSARTIVVTMAKGLLGSRKMSDEPPGPKYLYILLYLANIGSHTLEEAKDSLDMCHDEYDGIDTFCMERYGSGDLEGWCEGRDISFFPIYPTYGRQKEAYKEFYVSVCEGRFKAPSVNVLGTKEEDIFREEMGMIDHIMKPGSASGWFGSPEKSEKYGVQDDAMYAVAWCIFGGRLVGLMDFRTRKGKMTFGELFTNKMLLGRY